MPLNLNDNDLRDALGRFCRAAAGALCNTPEEAQAAFATGRFRITGGMVFRADRDLSRAQSDVVKRATKLLGSRLGNEKDIENALWASATAILGEDNLDGIPERFRDTVNGAVGIERQVILRNYLVRLADDVQGVTIGNVEIVNTSHLAARIAASYPDLKWEIVAADEPAMTVTESRTFFSMGPSCWVVTQAVASGNAEEEAAWLIDIAMSLFRYSLRDKGPLAPGVGDIEATPASPLPVNLATLTLTGGNLQTGAWSRPGFYSVSKVALEEALQGAILTKAPRILVPRKKTVGERLGQALGWLTRGRRATERAERFLMFFTAIEAILSSDDKSAPVVQTISRYAGVIWSNDVAVRASLAGQVKGLYAARSALVHTGARNISRGDADTIQWIAENICLRVLSETDPELSYQRFQEDMSAASYGLPWPAVAPGGT